MYDCSYFVWFLYTFVRRPPGIMFRVFQDKFMINLDLIIYFCLAVIFFRKTFRTYLLHVMTYTQSIHNYMPIS